MNTRVFHCRRAFTSMFPASSVIAKSQRGADGVIRTHASFKQGYS